MNKLTAWAHRSEPKRVDHERMYVWVHMGLPLVGLGIALRPQIVGLPTISLHANQILGLLIVWGSGLCLIAAAMGIGKFMPITQVDVRTPYAIGAFGQLSVLVSLSYYIGRIAGEAPWPILLSLGLTDAIAAACLHITVVALKEVWRVKHFKNAPDCPHWPKVA